MLKESNSERAVPSNVLNIDFETGGQFGTFRLVLQIVAKFLTVSVFRFFQA